MTLNERKKFLLEIKAICLASAIGLVSPTMEVKAEEATIQEQLGETNAGSQDPNYYYDPTSTFFYDDYVAYMSLPQYVRTLINEKNIKINIVGNPRFIENCFDLPDNVYTDGIYMPYAQQIFVESTNQDNYFKLYLKSNEYKKYGNNATLNEIAKDRSIASLYHEIGHFVDSTVTNNVYSNELSYIHTLEYQNFMNTHYYKYYLFNTDKTLSDIKEYLAISFSCYYLEPSELQEYCPQTYAYIQAIENKYNSQYGYNTNEQTLKLNH